jgi:hypothetical protein
MTLEHVTSTKSLAGFNRSRLSWLSSKRRYQQKTIRCSFTAATSQLCTNKSNQSEPVFFRNWRNINWNFTAISAWTSGLCKVRTVAVLRGLTQAKKCITMHIKLVMHWMKTLIQGVSGSDLAMSFCLEQARHYRRLANIVTDALAVAPLVCRVYTVLLNLALTTAFVERRSSQCRSTRRTALHFDYDLVRWIASWADRRMWIA